MKLFLGNLIWILLVGCGSPQPNPQKLSSETSPTKRDNQDNIEAPIAKPEESSKTITPTIAVPKKPSNNPAAPVTSNPTSLPSKPAGLKTLDQVAKEWKDASGILSLLLVKSGWDNFDDYVKGYENFVQLMKDPNSEMRKSLDTVKNYEATFPGIWEPFRNWMIHISDGEFKAKRDADKNAISTALNKHSKDAHFAGFFLAVDDIKNKILNNLGKLLGLNDFSNQREEMAKALEAMNDELLKKHNFQGTDFTDLTQEIRSLHLGGANSTERNDNLTKLKAASVKLNALLKKFE